MAERTNFLIGYGERLASDMPSPAGGAPKRQGLSRLPAGRRQPVGQRRLARPSDLVHDLDDAHLASADQRRDQSAAASARRAAARRCSVRSSRELEALMPLVLGMT